MTQISRMIETRSLDGETEARGNPDVADREQPDDERDDANSRIGGTGAKPAP